MKHFIEICDQLMMILDDDGNGYGCHELISYTEAQKQIERWAAEFGIDAGDACRQAEEYFSEQYVSDGTHFAPSPVGIKSSPLPVGTRVVTTADHEPGTIVRAVSFDPAIGWHEFEVQTNYGMEHWQRRDFVVEPEAKAGDA